MASVRKRITTKQDGTQSIAWQISWYDASGKRRTATRATKREADALAAQRILAPGTTRAPRRLDASVERFLADFAALVAAGERRETTLRQKHQHLRRHFVDHDIGARQIAEIRAHDLQAHIDALIADGVSLALTRKIVASIRQFWKFAAVRDWTGDAGAAAAASAPRAAGRHRTIKPARIPPKAECKAMLTAADRRAEIDRGRAAALFRVVMFAGLRAGEVRALGWSAIDLAAGEIRVERAADKYQTIHARPKTDHGRRTVPIGPDTIAALKRWRLACPPSPHDLAFPNERGGVWRHDHLYRNTWTPVLKAAGLADKIKPGRARNDARGSYAPAVWRPRYSPHTARHIAASIWIEQSAKAGAAVSSKWIMQKLGHASIRLSQELYGHLWPDAEGDAAIAAAAERAFD